MTSILAAAALGAWSYAGFLGEPAPTPPPPPPGPTVPVPSPANPIVPPAPDPSATDRGAATPAARPPARAADPASTAPIAGAAPSASRAVQPVRYRLADAWGQTWEHADPDALRAFVQDRNQAWLAPSPTPFFTYRAATCASGRCR